MGALPAVVGTPVSTGQIWAKIAFRAGRRKSCFNTFFSAHVRNHTLRRSLPKASKFLRQKWRDPSLHRCACIDTANHRSSCLEYQPVGGVLSGIWQYLSGHGRKFCIHPCRWWNDSKTYRTSKMWHLPQFSYVWSHFDFQLSWKQGLRILVAPFVPFFLSHSALTSHRIHSSKGDNFIGLRILWNPTSEIFGILWNPNPQRCHNVNIIQN